MTMISNRMREYRYYLSSGVNANVSIKISWLELAPALGVAINPEDPTSPSKLAARQQATQKDDKKGTERLHAFAPGGLGQVAGSSSELRNSTISEMFITAQIFSDGLPLHPMEIRYVRSFVEWA